MFRVKWKGLPCVQCKGKLLGHARKKTRVNSLSTGFSSMSIMILKFLTSSSVLHLNSIGLSACSRLHFLTHRSCNAVWPLGSFDHVQSFSFQSLSLFVLLQLKWRQRPQTVSSLPYRRNRWWELEAWWGPTKGRLPLPTQLLMSCSRLQATQHSRRTVTQTNRYAGHEIVKQK